MCSVLYSLRPYQRKQSVHTSKLSRALDALHCRTMPCQTSNRSRLWQGRGSRPQLELTSRPDPAADDICRTPQNKGSWTPMRSRHLLMLSIHCCAPGSLSFHSIALSCAPEPPPTSCHVLYRCSPKTFRSRLETPSLSSCPSPPCQKRGRRQGRPRQGPKRHTCAIF